MKLLTTRKVNSHDFEVIEIYDNPDILPGIPSFPASIAAIIGSTIFCLAFRRGQEPRYARATVEDYKKGQLSEAQPWRLRLAQ